LKKRYVLEELYRYSKYPLKWTPFQCFAVSYLSNLLSIGESELSSFNNGINELLADEALEDTQRHVNLDFKRIDPESVVTRRMIRSSQTPSSELWLQAFEKTDRAVKMHQEMLKNIAIYMCQSLGTSVLESLSIDMFVPGSRTNLVIELKSSTFENFYTQVVNGAIQLKEYCFELERESCQNNQAILIIQDTASSSMKSYCKEFLNYLDIQLLFYDSASDWPNRVVGLEEAVYAIRPKQSTWA